MTRSQALIEAVKLRLAAIQSADGFATDSGDQVVQGPELIDPTNSPGLVVQSVLEEYTTPSGDEPASGPRSMLVRNTITIASAITGDQADIGAEAEKQLGDIKRALCIGTHIADASGKKATLQLIRADKFPMVDGEQFEGVTVTIQCTYTEKWGDPDA